MNPTSSFHNSTNAATSRGTGDGDDDDSSTLPTGIGDIIERHPELLGPPPPLRVTAGQAFPVLFRRDRPATHVLPSPSPCLSTTTPPHASLRSVNSDNNEVTRKETTRESDRDEGGVSRGEEEEDTHHTTTGVSVRARKSVHFTVDPPLAPHHHHHHNNNNNHGDEERQPQPQPPSCVPATRWKKTTTSDKPAFFYGRATSETTLLQGRRHDEGFSTSQQRELEGMGLAAGRCGVIHDTSQTTVRVGSQGRWGRGISSIGGGVAESSPALLDGRHVGGAEMGEGGRVTSLSHSSQQQQQQQQWAPEIFQRLWNGSYVPPPSSSSSSPTEGFYGEAFLHHVVLLLRSSVRRHQEMGLEILLQHLTAPVTTGAAAAMALASEDSPQRLEVVRRWAQHEALLLRSRLREDMAQERVAASRHKQDGNDDDDDDEDEEEEEEDEVAAGLGSAAPSSGYYRCVGILLTLYTHATDAGICLLVLSILRTLLHRLSACHPLPHAAAAAATESNPPPAASGKQEEAFYCQEEEVQAAVTSLGVDPHPIFTSTHLSSMLMLSHSGRDADASDEEHRDKVEEDETAGPSTAWLDRNAVDASLLGRTLLSMSPPQETSGRAAGLGHQPGGPSPLYVWCERHQLGPKLLGNVSVLLLDGTPGESNETATTPPSMSGAASGVRGRLPSVAAREALLLDVLLASGAGLSERSARDLLAAGDWLPGMAERQLSRWVLGLSEEKEEKEEERLSVVAPSPPAVVDADLQGLCALVPLLLLLRRLSSHESALHTFLFSDIHGEKTTTTSPSHGTGGVVGMLDTEQERGTTDLDALIYGGAMSGSASLRETVQLFFIRVCSLESEAIAGSTPHVIGAVMLSMLWLRDLLTAPTTPTITTTTTTTTSSPTLLEQQQEEMVARRRAAQLELVSELMDVILESGLAVGAGIAVEAWMRVAVRHYGRATHQEKEEKEKEGDVAVGMSSVGEERDGEIKRKTQERARRSTAATTPPRALQSFFQQAVSVALEALEGGGEVTQQRECPPGHHSHTHHNKHNNTPNNNTTSTTSTNTSPVSTSTTPNVGSHDKGGGGEDGGERARWRSSSHRDDLAFSAWGMFLLSAHHHLIATYMEITMYYTCASLYSSSSSSSSFASCEWCPTTDTDTASATTGRSPQSGGVDAPLWDIPEGLVVRLSGWWVKRRFLGGGGGAVEEAAAERRDETTPSPPDDWRNNQTATSSPTRKTPNPSALARFTPSSLFERFSTPWLDPEAYEDKSNHLLESEADGRGAPWMTIDPLTWMGSNTTTTTTTASSSSLADSAGWTLSPRWLSLQRIAHPYACGAVCGLGHVIAAATTTMTTMTTATAAVPPSPFSSSSSSSSASSSPTPMWVHGESQRLFLSLQAAGLCSTYRLLATLSWIAATVRETELSMVTDSTREGSVCCADWWRRFDPLVATFFSSTEAAATTPDIRVRVIRQISQLLTLFHDRCYQLTNTLASRLGRDELRTVAYAIAASSHLTTHATAAGSRSGSAQRAVHLGSLFLLQALTKSARGKHGLIHWGLRGAFMGLEDWLSEETACVLQAGDTEVEVVKETEGTSATSTPQQSTTTGHLKTSYRDQAARAWSILLEELDMSLYVLVSNNSSSSCGGQAAALLLGAPRSWLLAPLVTWLAILRQRSAEGDNAVVASASVSSEVWREENATHAAVLCLWNRWLQYTLGLDKRVREVVDAEALLAHWLSLYLDQPPPPRPQSPPLGLPSFAVHTALVQGAVSLAALCGILPPDVLLCDSLVSSSSSTPAPFATELPLSSSSSERSCCWSTSATQALTMSLSSRADPNSETPIDPVVYALLALLTSCVAFSSSDRRTAGAGGGGGDDGTSAGASWEENQNFFHLLYLLLHTPVRDFEFEMGRGGRGGAVSRGNPPTGPHPKDHHNDKADNDQHVTSSLAPLSLPSRMLQGLVLEMRRVWRTTIPIPIPTTTTPGGGSSCLHRSSSLTTSWVLQYLQMVAPLYHSSMAGKRHKDEEEDLDLEEEETGMRFAPSIRRRRGVLVKALSVEEVEGLYLDAWQHPSQSLRWCCIHELTHHILHVYIAEKKHQQQQQQHNNTPQSPHHTTTPPPASSSFFLSPFESAVWERTMSYMDWYRVELVAVVLRSASPLPPDDLPHNDLHT